MAGAFRAVGHETRFVGSPAVTGTLDYLFAWNGAAATTRETVRAARSHGAQIIFAELGWLPQSGHCYFDPRGVGPQSTLADYEPGGALSNAQKLLLRVRLDRYKRTLAENAGVCSVNLPRSFVLVPLQVEADSQIVRHAPVRFCVGGMQVLIDEAAKLRPGRSIVYKMHPHGGRSVRDYVWPRKTLVATDGLADLLGECDEVITINSTVGLEAIAHYKPVTVLGDTFYSGWGQRLEPSEREAFLAEVFRRQWSDDQLGTPEVTRLLEGNYYGT